MRVTDEFIRHSHTPVLLVRPPDDGEDGMHVAPDLGRVLVPLDGSERAEKVLEALKALPGATEAHYTLLRIVRYPDELVSAYMPGTVHMSQQVVEEGLREAKAYMTELSARLRAEGLEVETQVSVESRPAASILCFAEDHDIDLIAVATHGRGGVPRVVMGSVTDKIVRGARVPVLVVRSVE
jgi:nucleotide-binding universal stress UspA family protein